MTNEEKIAAIAFWQDEAPCHPLTCGVKSSHAELRGKEVEGEVMLYCPTCDYTQEWWTVGDLLERAYEGRERIREMKKQYPMIYGDTNG